MNTDLTTLTLALLLTTGGALAAATFLTGFVAVLGRLFPGIGGKEPRVVAASALVLVILLAVAALQAGAMVVGVPLILAIVSAWYAVTRLAMSIYDDLTNNPRSLRNTSPQ